MGTPDQVRTQPDYLILFDGVCNLCNGAVLFVIRRDRKGIFRFASLQSPVGERIVQQLRPGTRDLYSIIFLKEGRVFDRSTAALEIARLLGPPWSLLYVFRIVPRFLRDAIYNLIARYRYRLFGKKDECMIPTPELKARFLE